MRPSKSAIIEAAKAVDLGTARAILTARPELLDVTDRGGLTLLHLVSAVQTFKLKGWHHPVSRLLGLAAVRRGEALRDARRRCELP